MGKHEIQDSMMENVGLSFDHRAFLVSHFSSFALWGD